MTHQERIEEAHGLWEIAITKALAICMQVIDRKFGLSDEWPQALIDALRGERDALDHWTEVSQICEAEMREPRQTKP